VQWVDTDASGLIHYTAALRYFEVAEHALMRRLFDDGGGLPGDRPFSMPRVHVEADYRSPLRYPDEFDCTARVAALGRSSVTYAYEARRLDGTLCLEGRIVAVAIDETGASMPLPPAFRARLEGGLA
jgi:acyl-CoA thioester hydrolase